MTQADAMYAALIARDYRFDGKFFTGVKTTGVYCRPICPARPKRENVEFFRTAVEAEKVGYRPCLRCRPECAPASPAWIGKSAVVQRALRLVNSGALLESNEDEFAERFGMSARHLRRLFTEEIGQTPKQIANTQRLNFARTLAVETRLPMTAIALNSGFASLRRFNEAFRDRFDRSPTEVRKQRRRSQHQDEDCISLELSYRPPFDWPHLLDFFGRHPVPEVERVDGNGFERVFRIGTSVGVLRLDPVPNTPKLSLRVFTKDVSVLFPVVRQVRAMFDLDSDPLLIANTFDSHPVLSRSLKRFPGLRIPGCWDAFETCINAILGQVVSVANAERLSRTLVEQHGIPGIHPLTGAVLHFFPSAKQLATANLANVPTTAGKREAIGNFACAVASGKLSLERSQDPEAFRVQLTAIRGIGNWTAEYITLRVLGDPDVFPKGDLVLRKSLARHPELDIHVAQPWRSYAALHLWKSELALKEK